MRNNAIFAALFLLTVAVFPTKAQEPLSLDTAIDLAVKNDPWLLGSRFKQNAAEYRSAASANLPDPLLSVGLLNMPTDSWDFNQEAMTQFRVGIAQSFPRGDTLTIRQQQLMIESKKQPLLREDRAAKLTRNVTQLWLDAFLAQKTIWLIEQDRSLFEQISEVAKAGYSNVIGKTRQQDVIRSQLELIQLEDRLTEEQRRLDVAIARLNQILIGNEQSDYSILTNIDGSFTSVSRQPPLIALRNHSFGEGEQQTYDILVSSITRHPAILAFDNVQKVSEKSVELARQQYKPKWGVNASYGYRDGQQGGDERADLFSVGVSVSVPLFNTDTQDNNVAASVAMSESVKTDRLLRIRQMLTEARAHYKNLNRLTQRQSLYTDLLLKQTHDQAEASLTAYTNDDGDFSEVVRARIAELNARISALKIDVDVMKTVANINYYLTKSQASIALK